MTNAQQIGQFGDMALIRKRLIESTLDCFGTYGYHGATLSRILDHAGVSRQSWQCLYDDKSDLVSEASQHFLSYALKGARDVEQTVSSTPYVVDSALKSIWQTFSKGRYRDVWVEFNLACRTDLSLYKRLSPMLRSFFAEINLIWEAPLARLANPGVTAETVINMSLYLLRTMSLKSISLDIPDNNRLIRDRWMSMIKGLMRG